MLDYEKLEMCVRTAHGFVFNGFKITFFDKLVPLSCLSSPQCCPLLAMPGRAPYNLSKDFSFVVFDASKVFRRENLCSFNSLILPLLPSIKCAQTELDGETVKSILAEYKIHNADVTLRSDVTADDLIDVVEGNR